MDTYEGKSTDNKYQSRSHDLAGSGSNRSGFYLQDNRQKAVLQRKQVTALAGGVTKSTPLLQSNVVVQRAEMKRIGAFPAVNDEIQTGNNVFADANASSIKVNILDEETDLYVGQDYLNTGLSSTYKADASKIRPEAAKVHLFDDENSAAVVDGHHRIIWGLYHDQAQKYQSVTIGDKQNIGSMKYADTPEAVPVEKKE